MSSSYEKKKTYLSTIKTKIFEYVKTSRLSSWMVAGVFLLLGVWYSSKTISFFPSLTALLSLGAMLSSASWINFVFDKELDEHAGDDISFFNHIPPREMLVVSAIFSIGGLIILFLINYFAAFVGLLIVLISIFYSCPPVRLKIHPPFDSFTNALLFGVLPILLGFTSSGNYFLTQENLVLLLLSGLIVGCYYILIDIFDIESDREYGIKTSCTILGLHRAINIALILFILSLIISFFYFGFFSPIFISLFISLPFFILIKIKNDIKTIAKILSCISFLWTELVLGYLFILSNSIMPLIIFVLVVSSAGYFLYVYVFIIKKSKMDKLH